MLGVVPKTLQRLEKQGAMARNPEGFYELHKAIPAWVEYQRALVEKKAERKPPSDMEELRASLLEEQSALTREKRIAQEMENAKTAGGLYEVDKADLEFADAIKGIVTLLATLPDRLERDCHISPDAVTRVQTEVDALRDRLWRRFALDADG